MCSDRGSFLTKKQGEAMSLSLSWSLIRSAMPGPRLHLPSHFRVVAAPPIRSACTHPDTYPHASLTRIYIVTLCLIPGDTSRDFPPKTVCAAPQCLGPCCFLCQKRPSQPHPSHAWILGLNASSSRKASSTPLPR